MHKNVVFKVWASIQEMENAKLIIYRGNTNELKSVANSMKNEEIDAI